MAKRWISVACGLILIGFGGAALYGFNVEKNSKLVDYHHDWKFDSEDLRSLSLTFDAQPSSIRFVPSTDGTNSVRVDGLVNQGVADRLEGARVHGGSLSLNFNQSDPWFNLSFGDWKAHKTTQTVTVSLTEEAAAALESLRVTSDAGSVDVSGSAPDKLSVSTDAGSIRVADFTGTQLKLNADAGKIYAENIVAPVEASTDAGSIEIEHLTGNAEISADAGSIKLVKDDTSSVAIETDAGSVSVQMPKTFAGTYDLKNDIGKIDAPPSKGETSDVVKVRTDVGRITIVEG